MTEFGVTGIQGTMARPTQRVAPTPAVWGAPRTRRRDSVVLFVPLRDKEVA